MGRPADPRALEHSIQIRTPRYKYLAVQREARALGLSIKQFVRMAIDEKVWPNGYEQELAEWHQAAMDDQHTNQFGWADVDQQSRRPPSAWKPIEGRYLSLVEVLSDGVTTREDFDALGLDMEE